MRIPRIRFGRRTASLFGAGAIMAFAAACSGGPGTATATPGVTGTPAAAACSGSGGTVVEVVDFAFNPAGVTVAVGETVTWTNTGNAAHTVSFTGGPDCGRINVGQSVSRTFSTTGFFGYQCLFHATMAGSVQVQ